MTLALEPCGVMAAKKLVANRSIRASRVPGTPARLAAMAVSQITEEMVNLVMPFIIRKLTNLHSVPSSGLEPLPRQNASDHPLLFLLKISIFSLKRTANRSWGY